MKDSHEGTKPRRRDEKQMPEKSKSLRAFVSSCEIKKEDGNARAVAGAEVYGVSEGGRMEGDSTVEDCSPRV